VSVLSRFSWNSRFYEITNILKIRKCVFSIKKNQFQDVVQKIWGKRKFYWTVSDLLIFSPEELIECYKVIQKKKKRDFSWLFCSEKIVSTEKSITSWCFTILLTETLFSKMTYFSVFIDFKIDFTGVWWKYQKWRIKSAEIFRKFCNPRFCKIHFYKEKKKKSPGWRQKKYHPVLDVFFFYTL
jgi:hypothetical protein